MVRYLKHIENVLAAVGLLAIIGLALFGVMNLVDRAQVKSVTQKFEPRMVYPIQADATMCQRGAGEKWKCRVYIRKERS